MSQDRSQDRDRRKDTRHRVQMPASLVRIERDALVTEDVSYHGLLMRAGIPLELGQLLRLELRPEGEEPIRVDGVPLRVHEGAYGDSDAVAFRLIGHVAPWERFVGGLQAGSMRRIRAYR